LTAFIPKMIRSLFKLYNNRTTRRSRDKRNKIKIKLIQLLKESETTIELNETERDGYLEQLRVLKTTLASIPQAAVNYVPPEDEIIQNQLRANILKLRHILERLNEDIKISTVRFEMTSDALCRQQIIDDNEMFIELWHKSFDHKLKSFPLPNMGRAELYENYY
jgi:hypothetical protein